MIAYDVPVDCTASSTALYLQLVDPAGTVEWFTIASPLVLLSELEPLPLRLGWHDCHRIPRELGASGHPPRASARAGRRGGERGLGVRNFARVA